MKLCIRDNREMIARRLHVLSIEMWIRHNESRMSAVPQVRKIQEGKRVHVRSILLRWNCHLHMADCLTNQLLGSLLYTKHK